MPHSSEELESRAIPPTYPEPCEGCDLVACPECNGCACNAAELYRHRLECSRYRGPWYVNVYDEGQCFGGPEEGGWWYDAGAPVESILCRAYSEAVAVLEERRQRCDDENSTRRPYHSVLSEGRLVAVMERHYARGYPETRPVYE